METDSLELSLTILREQGKRITLAKMRAGVAVLYQSDNKYLYTLKAQQTKTKKDLEAENSSHVII